jgi:luciferase family oxidoreductase group 1
MAGIASAATSVVIGHVAGGTSRIRVGAGGVMPSNHAPLAIAEQFGTLESLYPGRIDLGLGRAPGSDYAAVRALRRGKLDDADDAFPRELEELRSYFRPVEPGQALRAVPGAGLDVPIWLLGSSLFSAQLAAALGLPFAFASHFAPRLLFAALEVYRSTFRPSSMLARPYAMVAANVIVADTDAEAQRLFSSVQQRFLDMIRGRPGGPLPARIANMDELWSLTERAQAEQRLACSAVGSPATVHADLTEIITRTAADELIVTSAIFDHAARLRSFDLLAEIRDVLRLDHSQPPLLDLDSERGYVCRWSNVGTPLPAALPTDPSR